MKQLIDSLNNTLANVFEMYVRAHGMHWNIEGSDFPTYHSFFGDIYSEVYGSIDILAEQIRAVGGYVRYGTKAFSELNIVPDSKEIVGSKAMAMLGEIETCNSIVLKSLNSSFELAQKNNLQGLMNFLADRIDTHQKHGWMIRSCLK